MANIILKGNSSLTKNTHYIFDTDSEPLGEGGMGKVYRGRQVNELTGIQRDVAIKFMFDGLPQSVIDRARREASIKVVSEYLVEMIDFIETPVESPQHYHVVSELLTGVMLADLLNGVTQTKDGLEIPFAQNLYSMYKEDRANFALIIMKNVVSGIMALHDKGYIHRDIDPSNIMVTIDGKIKLIDFGIAKKLAGNGKTQDRLSTQDRTLTHTGEFIGKPQYAAPELVVGDVEYQNQTTDIYAMGILFYQLLVGRLPFVGPVTKVLEAQKSVKTPVKNIAGIPHVADFRAVVAKATEKDQDKRYQTAAELRVALDAIGTGFGKSFLKYYAAAGVLAAVVAAGAGGYLMWNSQSDVRAELYDASTAQEGWNHLLKQRDAASLYLQSRLFFKGDQLDDSIVIMQQNLAGIVEPDSIKAHDLLMEAYRQNEKDVHILYDLGLDFYMGEKYGVEERDLPTAKKYFQKALQLATESNDIPMQKRIQERLNVLKDI